MNSPFPLELEQEVRRHYRGLCGNCGSDHKPAPRLILPREQGGNFVLGNATLLCRACDMRAVSPQTPPERRPINLWVSHALHEWIRTVSGNGSTLVRSLVELYLSGPPERFDDLPYYQDLGTDTRLFVYVRAASYEAFRQRVTDQGLTLTDGVTGLLTMYRREGLALPVPIQQETP